MNVPAANRRRVALAGTGPTRGNGGGRFKDAPPFVGTGGKRLRGSDGSAGRIGISYGRRVG
jgi:hypothetical protein